MPVMTATMTPTVMKNERQPLVLSWAVGTVEPGFLSVDSGTLYQCESVVKGVVRIRGPVSGGRGPGKLHTAACSCSCSAVIFCVSAW